MADQATKVALVTGANSGIGREVARQLAVSGRYGRVILACRDKKKADEAKRSLEVETGARTFEVCVLDVARADDARRVAAEVPPIDDLVLNAGGAGGPDPLARTTDGVTSLFASNVLGHVVLLEALLASHKLRGTALYVGSEAARGVPVLGMKRPVTNGSVDELASFCDGRFFDHQKLDGALAYGQVKLVAALWMSALARRHPGVRLLTVSPGNTKGTSIAKDYPTPLRLFLTYVFTPVIAPLLGAVHDVPTGAARLVTALGDPSLRSGGFYASGAKKVTGPLFEQSAFFPELADPTLQDHAAEAIARFTSRSRTDHHGTISPL